MRLRWNLIISFNVSLWLFFIKLAIIVSKRENLNLVNRFCRIYHNISSSLPLCTSEKKVQEERQGTADVWKTHFGYTCERILYRSSTTPRSNVSQTMNVTVSGCAVNCRMTVFNTRPRSISGSRHTAKLTRELRIDYVSFL